MEEMFVCPMSPFSFFSTSEDILSLENFLLLFSLGCCNHTQKNTENEREEKKVFFKGDSKRRKEELNSIEDESGKRMAYRRRRDVRV